MADRLDRALLGAHVGRWPGQQVLASGAQLPGNAHQRLLHPFKLAVSDPRAIRLMGLLPAAQGGPARRDIAADHRVMPGIEDLP